MARGPMSRRQLSRPHLSRLAFALLLAVVLVPVALWLTAGDALAQELTLDFGEGPSSTGRIVQIVLLVTVLALAPSILVMVTSFVRIMVVLAVPAYRHGHAVRRRPTQVLISLALFLTFFIMMPTFEKAYDHRHANR